MENLLCPKCKSINVFNSRKLNTWICEDCGEKFFKGVETMKKWNSGLLADEFWNHSLISVAPVSLSISYQQLYNYVEEGNIGCTLFLIRDVFELMIKLPVVILLDGVYSVLERKEQPDEFLNAHPKFRALYTNSLQILTTGKWWECVRLGAGLEKEFKNEDFFSEKSELAYKETAVYLKKIYKMFCFQIPGQDKTNMVSWRNRAIGHSCLASNPEESYAEIPYILKMFKSIGEISASYYQRVSFADNSRTILRGTELSSVGEEIFVVFTNDEKSVFTKMHSFVAGKTKNLAYFDGYEKGKAYLLNYADGNRYKDHRLSEYLEKMDYSGNEVILSENSIDADNLETADINQLEDELIGGEKIVPVTYLYHWLMEQTEQHEKGIFLLQAERGMGKSTFCDTLDQLSTSENVLRFSDDIDGWTDFMETSAIRVWHFNSTYFGRQDIYIPGIASALLTLSNGHFENKKWMNANRLVGRLESMWDNLSTCEEGLRHVYFAEALNATIKEYQARTEKERIILVLDGLDEISDLDTLISYMPDISELAPDIYLLFTSRTDMELDVDNELLLKKKTFTVSLEFMRNRIVAAENGVVTDRLMCNEYYQNAIASYVDNAFLKNSALESRTLIERFEYRFSELAAYKRLCRINPVFSSTVDSDLMNVFIDVLRQNAPDIYFHKVEMILNALAWSGSSLTIRELAYLSGEQYVSYRFVGMLYDLQAFIKVVRTEKGNCYEFAHNEWETSVKEKFPYGDIIFRCLCNKLLDDISLSISDIILSEEYQGEMWIISNYCRVFNKAYYRLKENWFEDIKLDAIGKIWSELIKGSGYIFAEDNIMSENSIKLLKTITQVWSDYDKAVSIFTSVEYKGAQCSVKKSSDSTFAHTLRNGLSVAKLSKLVGNHKNSIVVATIYENVGNIYSKLAIRSIESDIKQKLAYLADACYRSAARIYNTEKDNTRIQDVIDNTYQSGRICQIAKLEERAKRYFEATLQLVLKARDLLEDDRRVEFSGAKACIRYGCLLSDINEKYDYFISAEKFLHALVEKSVEIDYLSWRTWLFRLMAKCNEEKKEQEASLIYWELAVDDAEWLFNIRGSDDDKSDLVYSLSGLSKNLLDKHLYSKVVPVLERLLTLDNENQITYLRDLSLVYYKLNYVEDKKRIDLQLLPLEREREEYADAYQEVLEIVKYLPDSEFKKIPTEELELYRKLANYSHDFKINPSIPLDEQNISSKANAIFVKLYLDYFATDVETQKVKELLELNSNIRKSNFFHDVMRYSNKGQFSYQDNLASVYNEVDLGLQCLPRLIIKYIPIQVLCDVIRKKNMSFTKTKKYEEIGDYSEQSISVIKELVLSYIPDSIIHEIQTETYEQKKSELIDVLFVSD